MAPDRGGLGYRIEDGRLAWEADPVEMHGDDALAAEAEDRGDAEGFLRHALADGPRPARDVHDDARREGPGDRLEPVR